MLVEQGDEPMTVAPIGRYAERECSACGVILPANQMHRVTDRKLTGFTESNRNYRSTTGTRGSGGTTSERYVIKDIDLCQPCYDSWQANRSEERKRSSVGAVIFVICGLMAAALLYAFATRGGSLTSNDTTSTVSNPSQDSSAGTQDQPSIGPSADNSAVAVAPDVTPTTAPSEADPVPSLPTQEDQAEAGAAVTGDSDPPAAVECSGAATVVVSMICSDAGLRSQNAQLAPIYRTLFGKATPEQRAQFAREQSAWIAQRDACDTQSCLATSYDQRLRTVTSEAWKQYNARNRSNSEPTAPLPSPGSKQPVYF